MANLEEFGISKQDFEQIFQFKPVYTLAQFGSYLNQLFWILSFKQKDQLMKQIKLDEPKIILVECLLNLYEESLVEGNLRKEQEKLF